jgi:hypothetical protein
MGSNAQIPTCPKGDWIRLNRILRQLAFKVFGPDSSPTFKAMALDYLQFNLDYENGSAEGRLQWNPDDGTLEFGMPGGEVNLQLGQEMLIRVTNGTGSQIDNGTPVYISGASGANIIVGPADASESVGVGFRTIAVATENIAAGQKGYVTTQGFVRDMDTSGFAAEGVPLYLAVGGGFASSPPAAPDVTVFMGIVTRKHGSEGAMYMTSLTTLPYFNNLSDVAITSLTDDDMIQYHAASKTWKNTRIIEGLLSLSAGVLTTGDLTALIAKLGGAVNHLAVSSGGILTMPGTSGIEKPHMHQSDSTTQSIADTAAAQVVTFDTDVHSDDITRTSSSRFTITKAGSYEVTISAVCDTTVAGKHLEMWLRKNGSDVADSNTRVHMPANSEVTLTVSFIELMAVDDYFEFWMWGDSTGARILATPVGTSPDRPAVPSIIMTVKYIASN